jgi:hypothetical protein
VPIFSKFFKNICKKQQQDGCFTTRHSATQRSIGTWIMAGVEDALSSAVDALESRFALKGVARQAVDICVGHNAVKFPLNAAAVRLHSLAPILTAATASPFGHGRGDILY